MFTSKEEFSNDHYKFMFKNAKIYKCGTWQNRIANQTEQMGKFGIYFSDFQPWLNFRSNQITRVAYILIFKRDQETDQERREETVLSSGNGRSHEATTRQYLRGERANS